MGRNVMLPTVILKMIQFKENDRVKTHYGYGIIREVRCVAKVYQCISVSNLHARKTSPITLYVVKLDWHAVAYLQVSVCVL